MAVTARKVPDALLHALIVALNTRQEEAVASFFHADTTQRTTGSYDAPVIVDDTISAANGTNLATNITLVNNIKATYNRHVVDSQAHNTAVSAVVSTADATDAATGVTLINALKAAYNTHLSASNVHFNNDATNAITNADATDTATTTTLANEMKGDFNAHVVSAPLGAMVKIIPA